jgi:hypothetical protein
MPACKFVTSYGAVLILIAQHHQITIREMAHRLGLTERLIHSVIAELAADGYLSRYRVGRVNQYRVHLDMPLGLPVLHEVTIGEVLQGMRAVTGEQTEVLAQPSRNSRREPTQHLPFGLPDATTETRVRNGPNLELVHATARVLREKARKTRETSRCLRAERARVTSSSS